MPAHFSRPAESTACHDPQPAVQRRACRSARDPHIRARLRCRAHRGHRAHHQAMGTPGRLARARPRGRPVGLPCRLDRWTTLLPSDELGRGSRPLVGPAGRLGGRPRNLGRHRPGDPRRSARAAPPRRRHPALPGRRLVAQAIGRIGNYFNEELFGGPTNLPWALHIDPAHRPAGYEQYGTFHPTFLYELTWNLALAGALVGLGRRRQIRAPGLFALYVAGYSAFRIFEELLRTDPAHHILGLRLNFFVATLLCLTGLIWFAHTQRAEASAETSSLAK